MNYLFQSLSDADYPKISISSQKEKNVLKFYWSHENKLSIAIYYLTASHTISASLVLADYKCSICNTHHRSSKYIRLVLIITIVIISRMSAATNSWLVSTHHLHGICAIIIPVIIIAPSKIKIVIGLSHKCWSCLLQVKDDLILMCSCPLRGTSVYGWVLLCLGWGGCA